MNQLRRNNEILPSIFVASDLIELANVPKWHDKIIFFGFPGSIMPIKDPSYYTMICIVA
jgi:hypothetical protein